MNKSKKIQIAMVDDHLLFREGFRDLLNDQTDMEIVAEGSDGREAMALVSKNKLDVLLIDLRLPKIGGISVIRHVKTSHPKLKVIVVSMYEDDEYKRQAFLAGADAYHSKMDGAQTIVKTIRALVNGKTVVEPAYLRKIQEEAAAQLDSVMPILTPVEHELLDELSKGRPNRELATRFAMSERTVKNHLNTIFRKLGVKSRLEAVRKAIDKKWISLVL